LFWRFKEEVEILFLDTCTYVDVDTTKKYNIILSPSLYWVKKLSLPLKYTHEVKKIAPSIFEEILPDGNYNYLVYKDGDEFLLFAYEDKKILELLESKGVPLSVVKGLYFAQSIVDRLDEPYRVNDETLLVEKEGIVLLLPISWYEAAKPLKIEENKRLKYPLKLQQYGHIVKSATLYKVIALLGVFSLLLIFEYVVLLKQQEHITALKDELFTRYHLKPTMMQNRAILASYEKKYKEQKELRQATIALLKSSLKQGEYIESILVEKSVLKVTFVGITSAEKRRVIANLSKAKIPFKTEYIDNKFVVEVKL
jgi:hypothetical protein